ncbi:MAG: site-specific integrase, partial [Muribaculaceae bacterium]|nr:site-specific integrase [Muribaculaceae bacterium]
GENPEVRRGFIFCLYAGLRWCDITRLTYQTVDFSNRLLRFEQVKTRGHSSSSSVVIPLSPMLLSLIGSPGTKDRDSHVFPLPSRRVAQTALRRWTAAAGIDKHITWHCARHSFALNLLNHGANIKTVASLLGHSTIRHTEKYTRAVDSLKRDAILSLSTPTHP